MLLRQVSKTVERAVSLIATSVPLSTSEDVPGALNISDQLREVLVRARQRKAMPPASHMPSRRASPLPELGTQPWMSSQYVSADANAGTSWALAAAEETRMPPGSVDGTADVDLFGDAGAFLWADGINFDLMNELISSIGTGDQMVLQGWQM